MPPFSLLSSLRMFAPNFIFIRSKRDVPSGGRSRHSISECNKCVDASSFSWLLFDANRNLDCCGVVAQGLLRCSPRTNAWDRGKVSKDKDANKIRRDETGRLRDVHIAGRRMNIVFCFLYFLYLEKMTPQQISGKANPGTDSTYDTIFSRR